MCDPVHIYAMTIGSVISDGGTFNDVRSQIIKVYFWIGH